MDEKKEVVAQIEKINSNETENGERSSYITRRKLIEERRRRKASVLPKWSFFAGALVIILFVLFSSFPVLKNHLLPLWLSSNSKFPGDSLTVNFLIGKEKNGTLSIKANHEPFLLIVTVDDHGLITRHFPVSPVKAVKIKLEEEFTLPIKKVLEGSPAKERLIIFSSRNELDESKIFEAINLAVSNKMANLCAIKSLNQYECNLLNINWAN